MIAIEINNRQSILPVDATRLRQAAEMLLAAEGVRSGEISLAVVDDPEIHTLNARWLEHDYPTDVISFVLDQDDDHLEGEVIVSAETAVRVAGQFDWSPDDELLLYVVHGLLHLVGYDDLSDEPRREMRAREAHYLTRLGLNVDPRHTLEGRTLTTASGQHATEAAS